MHATGHPPSLNPVPEQEALEREEDLRRQRRLLRIQQWHAQSTNAQTHEAYAASFPFDVEILAKEDVEALRQECFLRRFPRLLLARGALDILSRPTVAIVGSRAPTLYGRRMAALFGSELAKAGITVLSGGALGIDGIANKAALAHGATCAIVGGGLFCAHPRTNHPLFEAMARSGRGLILSQFPEHECARPWHFPCRNQTIAQLADFILVIEASPKSGSLITAEAALDAGRDLGALPGELENPLSRGTNALIADGAFCIRSPHEVLERVAVAHRMRKSPMALFESL
ncbi:MAG: DNA-protecting protein DprA [Silvanigrellales bacterium]|nr:DNA-protecting protein DprA [Silvanigrellales bacterium]